MQNQSTPTNERTNRITRRQVIKRGAALAAAAPLAALPFDEPAGALASPVEAMSDAPTITLADLRDDPDGGFASCPVPFHGGIPYVYGGDPWLDTDKARPILLRMAEAAVNRMDGPLAAVFYDILRAMQELAREHLPADAYEQYRELHALFDTLHIPHRELVIDVCARVLPHVDVRDGTFEDILQAAYRRGGIPDVAAANALVRSQINYSSVRRHVRTCFPDFDPERLSILTPNVGLGDRRGDA